MTLDSYHQEGLTPFKASRSRSAAWPYEEEGFGGGDVGGGEVASAGGVVLRCRLPINGAISFEQGFQGRRGGRLGWGGGQTLGQISLA